MMAAPARRVHIPCAMWVCPPRSESWKRIVRLTESGLRGRVEIWADGGVRSAADAVKLMCLGANRVGFGTLPMVAIGCTICRDCQLGTCHTGITTQIETAEQAQAMGLKHFVPRDFEQATQALVNVFDGLGGGGQEYRRKAWL